MPPNLFQSGGLCSNRDLIVACDPGYTAGVTALLHRIFAAGPHIFREKAEEHAYASAAADRLASGRADENRRIARRRRPAWADEA